MFEYLMSKLIGYITPSSVPKRYGVAIFVKKSTTTCLGYTQLPFHGSIMGRELIIAKVLTRHGQKINVATSHLESLQENAKERKIQLDYAIHHLAALGIPWLMGLDTNFSKKDGVIKLPDGVLDAWVHVGKPAEHEFTWDTTVNKNLDAPFKSRL
jgi:endonuclease/exonuclease/phosphatase family metal-dependent hydrolase